MKKLLFLLLFIPLFSFGQQKYIDYHENGKLKYDGFIKNGNPHGLWKGYYDDGNLEFEGSFVDGKKDGEWKMIFYDVWDETTEEYYQQVSIGEFKNDLKTGDWTDFYDLKLENLYSQQSYKNGILHGKSKVYYNFPKNQLRSIGYYVNGILEGPSKMYYRNGNIMSEGEYKNNKPSSFWRLYYEEGILEGEGKYDDGEESGIWVNYFKNGNIKMITPYRNGKKFGYEQMFDENGEISFQTNHSKENEEIEIKGYYGDNQIKYEIKMKGGKDNGLGVWKFFHGNGKLMFEFIWDDIDKTKFKLNCWDELGYKLNCKGDTNPYELLKDSQKITFLYKQPLLTVGE